MKRVISIALVALMIAALLVGCGSSSGPEGTYVVKSFNGKDIEESIKSTAEAAGVTVEDILKEAGISKVEELIVLELKADGSATLKEAIFGTTTTGTWKQDGSKINITMDDQTSEFTLSGNELSYNVDGQSYVLVKK